MDLFEQLRSMVGCEYISDLRRDTYLSSAKRQMGKLPLDGCSLRELEDMANYLYGEAPTFADLEQARRFFARGK